MQKEPHQRNRMIINDITNRSVGQALNNSRSITHATKSEPCPHCGKPDWCYSLGELSVCKRGADPTTGWIRTSKQDKDGDYFFAPEKIEKAIRPKSKQEFIYRDRNGQPLVKVSRSDDGDGHRRFFQSHWDGANWQKGLTPEVRRQIPIYRYKEVQEAIALGKPIFFVEGEGVANCLWDLGLAATTTIGGSKGYRKYGDGFIADLDGATELILCPDRDKPGLEYMDEAFKDFPSAKWLYAPPNDFYWGQGLPKSDGLDLKDWVNDGASVDMILAAIEERRIVVDSLIQSLNLADAPQAEQARSKNKQLFNFLQAQWGDRLRFNEMSLAPEMDGRPLKLERLSIKIAKEFDIDIPEEKAVDIILELAIERSYHPVREYLDRASLLRPDIPENRQLFETIASRYFGTSEDLYDAFMQKQ
ncbi:MAG: hypothetical protein HC903_11085 [Methylacidiphilales bacterium]|nr:hypothetical protein [Candidatus Methylacidiphilales bacterium]